MPNVLYESNYITTNDGADAAHECWLLWSALADAENTEQRIQAAAHVRTLAGCGSGRMKPLHSRLGVGTKSRADAFIRHGFRALPVS